MLIPPKLKQGDTIGIVSPSKVLDDARRAKVEAMVPVMEQEFELKVRFSKHAFDVDKYGFSAGSPEEKAEDINAMFADKSINAIWCSVGGHTANDVLDLLDYDVIKQNPKIFMGLSDITVLLNAIHHKTGLVTFHNGDPKYMVADETNNGNYDREQFKKRLMDGAIGEIDKLSEWKTVRSGSAQGTLIGGNLTCTLKLAGTPYMPDMSGAILLLEVYHAEPTEAQYRLTQLKHMGVFDKISGVVLGHMHSFQVDPGYDVQFEDILLDVTKNYDFPILKIDEFGHKCPNTPLPIGGVGSMDADKKLFGIIEACVG